MTLIGRLVGVFSALVMTCSMLSCADGTKQSPLAPSQTPAAARPAPPFDARQVDMTETADLTETAAVGDEISAAVGKPGSVAIVVKEKTTGISGVKVTVTCPGFSKSGSTKSGKVTITGVTAGITCLVTVTHANYTTQTQAVKAKSSQTVTVGFTIVKKPAVPPVPSCGKQYDLDLLACEGIPVIDKYGNRPGYFECRAAAGCKYWTCKGLPAAGGC